MWDAKRHKMFFTLAMITIVVGNQSLQACHFHSPIDGGASETGELLELVCGCTGLCQGTSSLVLLSSLLGTIITYYLTSASQICLTSYDKI